MARTYGIQASTNKAGIDLLMLAPEWETFCKRYAEAMLSLAQHDVYPTGHATLEHGQQPPGLYRESYKAWAERRNDYFHAVLANTEREAIWIESGTHPGGGSTYIPGRHVMARAMEGAAVLVRAI